MTRVIMALAGSFLMASSSIALAESMMFKLVERATTDVVTDLGEKEDSAGDLPHFRKRDL